MRIKFKSFSRSAIGKYRPGSIADLPDDVAMDFLNKGYAELVQETNYETTAFPVEEMETTMSIPVVTQGKKKKKHWWKKK